LSAPPWALWLFPELELLLNKVNGKAEKWFFPYDFSTKAVESGLPLVGDLTHDQVSPLVRCLVVHTPAPLMQ
jgi:hypothetical protein